LANSRDHHFVPVFYLKQWTDSAGKVVEYSRKNGRVLDKQVGPKATGFASGLNSFAELPPELSEFLEDQFFQAADNDAAVALRLLRDGKADKLDVRLRSAWSRFLIGMRMRHPDAMQEMRAIALQMWRKSRPDSQAAYERHRIAEDPETLEEYVRQADPLIEPKIQIRLIQGALDNKVLGARLNGATWIVLDVSSAGFALLTSDRPLEVFHFQDHRGFVSIPIAPSQLFVASSSAAVLSGFRRIPPTKIVRQVNQFVVERARTYAYALDLTQDGFIKKRMSRRVEATPFFPDLSPLT
jgi:hypothetical protein